jgi:DNA ligase-1
MKSPIVEPGEFIQPSGAQLRSAPNKNAAVKVWEEVGECLGYPKPDGWRIQIHKIGASVKLFSRKGNDYAGEYPSIVQMIRTQVEDDLAILDTELVGFDQHGHHLAPAKLRSAAQYHCYLLDALYLSGNLISLPTQHRVEFIREHLPYAFHGIFTFAEYTPIRSQDELIRFYQACLLKRKDGFDGAIIKRLSTPYFTDALKLKTEDTADAVVIGAYRNEKSAVQSLLLAVLSHELKLWVPIAKVTRTNTDWDTIWTACQPYVIDYRPSQLAEIADIPDIWIAPGVVVEITMTELRAGKDYIVRAEYPRKYTLREDKGPEDATSFEQILQIAGLTEIMKTLSERAKRQQLSLFEDNGSTVSEFPFAEDEEASSFEKTFPAEASIQQNCFNYEGLIQLRLGLFE